MKIILIAFSVFFYAHAMAGPIDSLLNTYQGQGAGDFDAVRGKEFWQKKYAFSKEPKSRNCQTCHGEKLTEAGKHVQSGKPIKPMSPVVNVERLTDIKKIEKWFKRNCKFTLGRECTPQEKGDVLAFLILQNKQER